MDNSFEREIINKVIKFIVILLKWICLLVTVLIGGMTIGFLIMALLRNVDLPNTMAAKMINYVTFYSEDDAILLIEKFGMFKTVCSSIMYGFSTAITYGLFYYLLDKFLIVFDNITKDKVYIRENMNIVKKCLYAAMLSAVVSPLIIAVDFFAIGINGLEYAEYNGIFYALIAYTFYLLFKKGYELENKNNKLNKEVDKIKEEENDKKIEEVKKEIKKRKSSK